MRTLLFFFKVSVAWGPIYMEKTCPSQEGGPSSRINFSERQCEKQVDPFAWASHSGRVDTSLFIRGVNSSTYLV